MWTPSAAAPLVSGAENQGVSTNVTYTPDNPLGATALSYSWEWLGVNVPYNLNLVSGFSPARLFISGPDRLGIAPVEVVYLENDQLGTATKWSDVPVSAEQIIQYKPPVSLTSSIQLKVTAHLSNGSSVSQTYTLLSTVDYTTGRDQLVAAVNSRR